MREIFYTGKIDHKYNKSKIRYYNVYKVSEDTLEYELSQNVHTIIDFNCFTKINDYVWRAQKDKSINSYYALTNIDSKAISLHRFLAGILNNETITVDHIDKNPLNNKLCNLRLATNLQQCFNQNQKKSKSSSAYWGVTRRSENDSYRVRAQNKFGKQVNLGTFKCEILAAEKWDEFMFNEYENHNPLKDMNEYNIQGQPTINFISFNFPEKIFGDTNVSKS